MSTAYADAANLPVSAPTPIVSYSPLVLDVPGRPVPLELKVSMPATGTNLPVILFAHDPPDGDPKHFINPLGKHEVNKLDQLI